MDPTMGGLISWLLANYRSGISYVFYRSQVYFGQGTLK